MAFASLARCASASASLTACLALVLAACAGPGSGARPVDDASLPAASVLLGGSAGIAADPAGAAPSASTERLISADEAASVAAPDSEGTPWAKGGLAVSAIAVASFRVLYLQANPDRR